MDNFLYWSILNSLITVTSIGLLFLIVVFFLRPRIKISDYISNVKKEEDFYSEDGFRITEVYNIKIINKSFFNIYDVRARLTSNSFYNTRTGKNVINYNLGLLNEEVWVIEPISKKPHHGYIFTSRFDLAEVLREGKSITFQIIARHSLTGFTRLFSKTYYTADSIVAGSFESGKGMKVH